MNGFIGDRLQEGDPTPFFESIEQAESFKSQGIAYTGKIAFVHVAGKAASGAVEETGCERPPLPPTAHPKERETENSKQNKVKSF